MNREEIKKGLDALYGESKSKNFINHIIKAYLPLDKVAMVATKPKDARLVCALTKQRLMATDEIIVGMQNEEFKESLNANIATAVEGSLEPTAMTKVMKGRVLGFTGDKTTTLLSYFGVQILFEWVTEKALAGDKHIIWLLKSMSEGDKPFKSFKKKTGLEANGYRKPSTTFGELDALQRLKEQYAEQGI